MLRQNYSGRKKPEQLLLEDIFAVARTCSYSMACRSLAVSRHQLERFLKEKYPEIHEQLLTNGQLVKYRGRRGKWN